MRSSSSRKASASISQQGIGSARQAGARRMVCAASDEYGKANPELADHLTKMQKRELPDGWDKDIPDVPTPTKKASPDAIHPAKC